MRPSAGPTLARTIARWPTRPTACSTPLRILHVRTVQQVKARPFCLSAPRMADDNSDDPRIRNLGRDIADDFARIRDNYAKPRYPIVLAHGLLGFSEFKLAGWLPPVHYWFGIQDALAKKGIRVITTSVPASATVEERAAHLLKDIEAQVPPDAEGVNIVAHSMGGLDARYMISRLHPNIRVRSLVTIATPHRGSAVADVLMESIGPRYLPRLYRLFERATGLETGAFEQLTTRYMAETFNPAVPDDPDVRYFSYGAAATSKPPLLSPFRHSHKVLHAAEGRNDGLVSVASSNWGTYKGTLLGLNHLDLINWSNRLRWTIKGWIGQPHTFNAIAFYLDIADMLAKEDL